MKRVVLVIGGIILAITVLGIFSQAFGQTPEPRPLYVVQPGDTVYALKGIYSSDQPEWKAFTIVNPFLAEPGRAFIARNGRFIVIIRPDEMLDGVDRLGLEVEPLPISELGLATVPESVPVSDEVVEMPVSQPELSRLPWWLIPAVVLGAILAYLLYRTFDQAGEFGFSRRWRRRAIEPELRRDPVASGPPLVPGGIQPTETDRLENFFEQQAVEAYARRTPGVERSSIRVERIGPIQGGTISGEGMVSYLGQEPQPRRFDPPVAAYQARFRMPDGTEEVLQSLMACMNPVVYGGETLHGFTFTPAEEVVPAPAPPEPERPRPMPLPMPVAARTEDTLFVFGRLRMMVPLGSIIRVAEDGEVSLSVAGPADITVRLDHKVKRPKVVKTAAAAG